MPFRHSALDTAPQQGLDPDDGVLSAIGHRFRGFERLQLACVDRVAVLAVSQVAMNQNPHIVGQKVDGAIAKDRYPPARMRSTETPVAVGLLWGVWNRRKTRTADNRAVS